MNEDRAPQLVAVPSTSASPLVLIRARASLWLLLPPVKQEQR